MAKASKTKSERFREEAETRTNLVLKQIEQLRKLSNRASYEYAPEEVAAVFQTIDRELGEARALFNDPPRAAFALPPALDAGASE